MRNLFKFGILAVLLPLVTLAASAQSVSAADYCNASDASIVVRASYDETGRFLSCELQSIEYLTDDNQADPEAVETKAFILTKDYQPLLKHDIIHHDAQAATCTEIGWNAYDECSRCDYTTCVEIPALGHDLVHHDAQAATCTEIGWDAYDTCSRCDYTTYVEIPSLGHNFTNYVSDGNATCKVDGTKTAKCNHCDAIDTIADVDSHLTIAHTWNDGEITTAATCTETGVKTFICTVCGETKTADVAALGHDLVHHDAQAATCTEIGWEAYDTCSRCDYTTYQAIPMSKHEYTSEITPPSCTSQGYTTHTCIICGDSYDDSFVDQVEHAGEPEYTWDLDESLCYASLNCSECGTEIATETASVTIESSSPATCSEPGLIVYLAQFESEHFSDQRFERTVTVSHKRTYTVLNEWQIEVRCSVCEQVLETLSFSNYKGMTYKAFNKLSKSEKMAIENEMGESAYAQWVQYLKAQQEAIEFDGEL